jgi:hypothetical protein
VGIYVGEDENVSMSWVESIQIWFASPGSKKTRCAGIRRTPWKIAQPENVRAIAGEFVVLFLKMKQKNK